MSKKEQVEQLTDYMANFVSYIAKVLPDDWMNWQKKRTVRFQKSSMRQ